MENNAEETVKKLFPSCICAWSPSKGIHYVYADGTLNTMIGDGPTEKIAWEESLNNLINLGLI